MLNNIETAEVSDLLVAFEQFEWLPKYYKQNAFKTIFEQLLEKASTDPIFLTSLPYKRMTGDQVLALHSRILNIECTPGPTQTAPSSASRSTSRCAPRGKASSRGRCAAWR